MASKLKAKSPELTKRRKPQIVIFGKSGVGKTWQALDFPKCYYIDCEGGAKEPEYTNKLIGSGGMYLGPEDGSLDFKEVISQVQALATERHEFKTLIIDSISKLFNATVGNEQERLGDKDQYGASKKAPVAFMRRLINWFSRLDMNVILVCHEKEEYGLNTKNEREVIGYTYDCWDRLEYELDLVIRIEKQGPRRTMRVRKSRISSFEEGRVYDWNYNNFATMYGEDTIQREVESIKLATGEQVHEILRLIDLMKVSSEDTARWLTKANAESFDELSMDQASKTLEFLNSKLRGAA